jgi:uncharacterized peroxidase-related enzyme
LSHLAEIDEADATGETAALYAAERERAGYLPGYARAFGRRPPVYRAWQGLVAAVASSMANRRYELATVAAARELRSSYCSLAHGEILATRHLPAADVVALAAGDPGEALDAAEREVVRFAAKVARSAPEITTDDVETLRAQGLDDAEILDVVLAVAARCFFSTVLDATGTLPDAVYRDRLDPVLREALTVGRPVAEDG